jgi:2-haloacid dehalogenase
MVKIKALLFDVFGTVVDWRTGVAEAVSEITLKYNLDIDPFIFADTWRAEYQPAMEAVRCGARAFTILDNLHEENLEKVKKTFGLMDITNEDTKFLLTSWHRLPGWSDSSLGLKRLKKKFIIGTQSNGNISLLVNMAKHSDLPWDVILGAEVVGYYKPIPEAYDKACKMLTLEPDQCMMVAAHNDDLEAARTQGMKTAYIKRRTEHGKNQSTDLKAKSDWDYISDTIIDLAEQLDCP